MDFFKTNNYDINDFRETIHCEAVHLLKKCTKDEALADKIFALVADEFLKETVTYQKTQSRDISDKEIGVMLGIVIYNRLLRESELHHETN